MAPKRGRAGLSMNLLEKRERAAETFSKLDDDETNREQAADLDPHKITPCRRAAVLGIMFDQRPDDADKLFGATVKYIYKVPKENIKDTMSEVLRVNHSALQAWEKARKFSLHKLLCRSCMVTLNGPVNHTVVSEWSAFMLERAKKIGFSKASVVESPEHDIDWNATGWFTLLPAPGEAADLEKHRYLSVRLMGKEAPSVSVVMFGLAPGWATLNRQSPHTAGLQRRGGKLLALRRSAQQVAPTFCTESNHMHWLPIGGGRGYSYGFGRPVLLDIAPLPPRWGGGEEAVIRFRRRWAPSAVAPALLLGLVGRGVLSVGGNVHCVACASMGVRVEFVGGLPRYLVAQILVVHVCVCCVGRGGRFYYHCRARLRARRGNEGLSIHRRPPPIPLYESSCMCCACRRRCCYCLHFTSCPLDARIECRRECRRWLFLGGSTPSPLMCRLAVASKLARVPEHARNLRATASRSSFVSRIVVCASCQAKLPEWLVVSGSWSIDENWSITQAHLAAPGLRKQLGGIGKLIDCFDQADLGLLPALADGSAPSTSETALVQVAKDAASSALVAASPAAKSPGGSRGAFLTPPEKKARKLSADALKAIISSNRST